MPLHIGSSTVIEYLLTNPMVDPIYVNDANVTVTILDSTSNNIAGESWPVTLPYVIGSNGVYKVTFEPFTGLVDGQTYTVRIDVVGVDGLKSECETIVRAKRKNC